MPQQGFDVERLAAMRGRDIYGSEGDKIGEVDSIFYDDDTGEPEWILTSTGFMGMKSVLIPLAGARIDGDSVRVPYAKDKVKNAPGVSGDEVTVDEEREVYAHYGLQPATYRSNSQLPQTATGMPERNRVTDRIEHERGTPGTGLPHSGTRDFETTQGEASVTRHEEELHIGKRERETGRARLRKWVDTEPVREEIRLRRERARIERETINEPAPNAQLGEQNVEMRLTEEEPVVSKETVARERIRMRPETETHTETVEGEVRRERVDVADTGTDIDDEEEHRRRSRLS